MAPDQLRSRSHAPWILLILVLIGTALLRLPTIHVPLERDEGEYAYGGQLLLQGIPPYAAAYSMKFPGIYGAYALVLAIFGQSPSGVHWGLLLVNAAAIVLVFLLARRLYGSTAGVVAAATYAFLSMGRPVLGMAAHATQFLVVPALLGTLLLARDRPLGLRTAFASGLCMGLAVLMKQHGIGFALFGLAVVLGRAIGPAGPARGGRGIGAAMYVLGVAVPLVATCLALRAAGVFDRFWLWTVDYARSYASERNPRNAWRYISEGFSGVTGPSFLLWVLGGLGFVAIWLERGTKSRARFITALLAGSLLAVAPGLIFRQHYFVPLLPAVAILVGAAVAVGGRLLPVEFPPPVRTGAPLLFFAIALGHSLWSQGELFACRSPTQIARDIYGGDPFPEAIEIARYIRANSESDRRIAVLGSEPEIYFYARRRSATGYIYTYGLVESQPYAHHMQEEMIHEIEAAKPEYLIFVNVWTSWLAPEGSANRILDWYRSYADRYQLVGVADIYPERTTYRWGRDAAAYKARSEYVVYVFRRPPASPITRQ